VRSLALAYALAGADCIDVAADPAVVAVAQEGLSAAAALAEQAAGRGYRTAGRPWLMVSLNDGEDPHFRKAEFDPAFCPSDCPRPCVPICPVQAIRFEAEFSGVVERLCYGCGRCLAICPVQQISARSYIYSPAAVAPLVLAGVDAVEIHTQVGRLADFGRLWQAVAPYVAQLKLVSISCPDGEGLIEYLKALHSLVSPLPCALIWQTDGRPMSGDLGNGATRAAVKLGRKVLSAGLPGYVQLAGGTNRHTIKKLKMAGLLSHGSQQNGQIAGIAYGSYARSILAPILEKLEVSPFMSVGQRPEPLYSAGQSQLLQSPSAPNMPTNPHQAFLLRLEDCPELLWQAVQRAHELVADLKPAAKSELRSSAPYDVDD
jgi:Fe-S-cluster-containing hydrogenase component 2